LQNRQHIFDGIRINSELFENLSRNTERMVTLGTDLLSIDGAKLIIKILKK